MQTIFETENLIVRSFDAGDAVRLYEYHLDAKVKQWIPNESYEDVAEAADAIGFFSERVSSGQLPYVVAVESKVTGELIGDTGINEVDGKPGEVEIGFVISDAYSGRGYATELVGAMTSYVREEFEAEDDPYGNGMLVYVLKKFSTEPSDSLID